VGELLEQGIESEGECGRVGGSGEGNASGVGWGIVGGGGIGW